jgi:hypothetical protein
MGLWVAWSRLCHGDFADDRPRFMRQPGHGTGSPVIPEGNHFSANQCNSRPGTHIMGRRMTATALNPSVAEPISWTLVWRSRSEVRICRTSGESSTMTARTGLPLSAGAAGLRAMPAVTRSVYPLVRTPRPFPRLGLRIAPQHITFALHRRLFPWLQAPGVAVDEIAGPVQCARRLHVVETRSYPRRPAAVGPVFTCNVKTRVNGEVEADQLLFPGYSRTKKRRASGRTWLPASSGAGEPVGRIILCV